MCASSHMCTFVGEAVKLFFCRSEFERVLYWRYMVTARTYLRIDCNTFVHCTSNHCILFSNFFTEFWKVRSDNRLHIFSNYHFTKIVYIFSFFLLFLFDMSGCFAITKLHFGNVISVFSFFSKCHFVINVNGKCTDKIDYRFFISPRVLPSEDLCQIQMFYY